MVSSGMTYYDYVSFMIQMIDNTMMNRYDIDEAGNLNILNQILIRYR